MKVFNKEQVEISAVIPHALGIDIGDMLDVRIEEKEKSIELQKKESFEAEDLVGTMAEYGKRKEFPSRKSMNAALQRELSGEA